MTPGKVLRRTRLVTALAAALAIPPAAAVSLNPDGLGQALIFPYYTVRSVEGANAFNTYVSVVNHTADAKAVRVRVREGRAAKSVLDFNLYLSPNDVWAAAIVPTGDGARILTTDNSCTDPAFNAGSGFTSLDFRNNLYTGVLGDGFGDTLDRTREGYVEMIEMATLTNESRTFVTHNSAGVPANCAAIRAANAPAVARPTGGLSGTLTLINVASGLDFTVNAEALADLASRPYFRAAADPYPDFAAQEVDPVSLVVANGQAYRSTWNRGLDAVSAVLMRTSWHGEFVLDPGSASLTDFVVTQPTRHHHSSPAAFQPPYSARAAWSADCFQSPGEVLGERLDVTQFNREERFTIPEGCGFPVCPPAGDTQRLCAAAGVASIRNGSAHQPPDTTRTTVLGSATGGLYRAGNLLIGTATAFPNGWITSSPQPATPAAVLVSLNASTRVDLASGQVTTGAHTYSGLPIVGFAVRTFRNGTLACTSGACQGNYGGAFPFKYTRQVTP